MEDLTAVIKQKAHRLGFNRIGFVPAQPSKRLDAYLRWVENEMYGRMGYMARPDRIARRRDLNVILSGVQTIICVALDYATLQVPSHIANDPGRGRISNYAWNLDYHDIMTPRLQQLADWLAETVGADNRVYVDTGAILERDHAESAGLGFTGKNTMLIAPRGGSYFFLGEILTTVGIGDRGLGVGEQQMPSCGTCHRCLDACPTNAFPEPHVLDARRCISYLTIELKGWLPRALRPYMGNWIYGCDVCQEVCPFNRFTEATGEVGFFPAGEIGDWLPAATRFATEGHEIGDSVWEQTTPSLLDLLALDEDGFQERFAHSPIKRIGRVRLLRNVCVAVGNWGSETAVPQLTTLLTDPEPIIRGHAAWALHQIGTAEAKTAVAQAIPHETDENVLAEIQNEPDFKKKQ